jgi:hypothetical protein
MRASWREDYPDGITILEYRHSAGILLAGLRRNSNLIQLHWPQRQAAKPARKRKRAAAAEPKRRTG